MKKLANSMNSPLLLLACSLLTGGGLQAGIIGLNSSSGPITPGAVTPGMYTYPNFGGDSQSTLVIATLTGLSTGDLTLATGGNADWGPNGDGGGNRLLLSLTNNTGFALTGIQLDLFGTTFYLQDSLDPSRGTFDSNTFTSSLSQSLNSPGVSATGSQVIMTFDAMVDNGASTAFYLPIWNVPSSQITAEAGTSLFTLSVTPSAADVPEPATLGLAAAALIGLGLVKRRKS